MSIDDRLRNGLPRNAAPFEPEVEIALQRVVARARRKTQRRLVVAGVAAVAFVVGLLIVAERPRDERGTSLAPERTTVGTAPAVQALTGRFETTVDAVADQSLQFNISGHWVIELSTDGSMRVTAPDTYTGVLSAPLFQATPERFRTSLFEQDLCSGQPLGTYRWALTGSTLRFTVVDDPCAGRVALFASQEWSKIS
jgi:hypothetical protein